MFGILACKDKSPRDPPLFASTPRRFCLCFPEISKYTLEYELFLQFQHLFTHARRLDTMHSKILVKHLSFNYNKTSDDFINCWEPRLSRLIHFCVCLSGFTLPRNFNRLSENWVQFGGAFTNTKPLQKWLEVFQQGVGESETAIRDITNLWKCMVSRTWYHNIRVGRENFQGPISIFTDFHEIAII